MKKYSLYVILLIQGNVYRVLFYNKSEDCLKLDEFNGVSQKKIIQEE